jgi:hypothetical protein
MSEHSELGVMWREQEHDLPPRFGPEHILERSAVELQQRLGGDLVFKRHELLVRHGLAERVTGTFEVVRRRHARRGRSRGVVDDHPARPART